MGPPITTRRTGATRPALAPRGIRLGDPALAHTPARTGPGPGSPSTAPLPSPTLAPGTSQAMQAAWTEAPPPGGGDIPMSLDEKKEDIDMGMVGLPEPTKDDVVAELLIQQFGGSPHIRTQTKTDR